MDHSKTKTMGQLKGLQNLGWLEQIADNKKNQSGTAGIFQATNQSVASPQRDLS